MNTHFDLIVIGAGINGAGIARDAAMRGLTILLVDKGDIGGGTSSWSTRLIHGGLRYLEHGEFGLVRESLRERETLMHIAPHLVRPVPILVPIYKGARRGRWTIRAGMLAYDLLSFDKTLPRHRMLSPTEAIQQAPGLQSDGLKGAALYYDAQVEFAERLVLENAISAAEHGAEVLTHTRVERFILERGKLVGIEFKNEIEKTSGQVSGRVFINAAGPWVDEVLSRGAATPAKLIGGTKGSHIIVPAFTGAPRTAIYLEAANDGRPFFIIPWNGKYLIGTTDIRYDGDLDHVVIDETEIDYLLNETNRVLPQASLDRQQILYTYSGVRPLPHTATADEQSITRRHFIRRHPQFENLLSIVGGKLTTYRSLAEEVVDRTFTKLGQRIPKCRTGEVSLPGNAGAKAGTIFQNFLTPAQVERLVRVYGDCSGRVIELIRDEPTLGDVIDEETGAVAAEVVYSFKHEFAQTLADTLLRRTMIGLNSKCGRNALERTAEVGRKYLGWTESRCEREIRHYRDKVNQMRGKGAASSH